MNKSLIFKGLGSRMGAGGVYMQVLAGLRRNEISHAEDLAKADDLQRDVVRPPMVFGQLHQRAAGLGRGLRG